jgi:hypothetical protein
MKLVLRSAPLMILLLAACAGNPAQTPTATAAATSAEQGFRTASEAEAAAKDDDLICRTERKTGSRFETKQCATRAEWRRVREGSTEDYRRAATRGPAITPGG